MLYACYESAANGEDFSEQLDNIHARYQEIIDGLNLDFLLILILYKLKKISVTRRELTMPLPEENV